MNLLLIALAILAGLKIADVLAWFIDRVEEGNSYNKPWLRYPHVPTDS